VAVQVRVVAIPRVVMRPIVRNGNLVELLTVFRGGRTRGEILPDPKS
jgi:hypothetical protein